MRLHYFSYRFAQEVLDSRQYRPLRNDITTVLSNISVPRLATPKSRTRGGKTRLFTADQKALNKVVAAALSSRGWELSPWIVADRGTQLKADFKKGRIHVEVQFGNMARVIYDLFKLQVSYSQDIIDVGIIVVPMRSLANEIDENVAHFERLVRELKYARMSITLPIWIVGIDS